jgi:NAD(P)-dependent dehydrogenase (short-subunit alcohol dehydrogenase family)
MPSQKGCLAVVTGTGGLGLEVVLALLRVGAEVIIAGRNPEKGRAALQRIEHEVPHAQVRFVELDLASLVSVAAFGSRLRTEREGLDLLVNNAAVMAVPERRLTHDGFELQFGTNHLGHVALTAHLLPLLRRNHGSRVVSLSSLAARGGVVNISDLQSERRYRPFTAYSQSKLASLMFALELQRRSERAGWGVVSIAAHPGIARTDLFVNSSGPHSLTALLPRALPFLFQAPAQGALPILFASMAAEARPGGYYGPKRLGETRGHPAPAKVPPQALDQQMAARLWEASERLIGLTIGQSF